MSPTSYFHGDKKIAYFKSAEAGGQETVLTISPLDGSCQFCPDRWRWTLCYSAIAEVSCEDKFGECPVILSSRHPVIMAS